jgi:hypothetical protein
MSDREIGGRAPRKFCTCRRTEVQPIRDTGHLRL